MKMIGDKLRSQGRTRWAFLAAIIIVAVIIIVGITVAIYFARNGQDSDTEAVTTVVGSRDGEGRTPLSTRKSPVPTTLSITFGSQTTQEAPTLKPSTQPPTTQQPITEKYTTHKPMTKQPTTQNTTTQRATTQKPTMQNPSTQKPTIQNPTTQKPTTQNPTSQKPITQRPTTQKPTTRSPTVETTTAIPTTAPSPVEPTDPRTPTTTVQSTSISNNEQTGNESTNATQSPPTMTTSHNLTVSMSNILYNPTDVTSLTLFCEGSHSGAFESLAIHKQFKDGYEAIALAVLGEEGAVEVIKFLPNMTHLVSVNDNRVSLTLYLDPFRCIDITNYTCTIANKEHVAKATALVQIFMPEPYIKVPHSIVEDKEVKLSCLADVWGTNGAIVWKFKPESTTKFMDFSVAPVNKLSYNNCTTVINSTLTFNVTLFEHGATFRCEVVQLWDDPKVIQTTTSDVTIKVVPADYCIGKRLNTIYPHPDGPCTLVVFCVSTGPLVFEIECEPNQCYDYVKTACVPRDTG
ncbi:uncharacterized protein LOC128226795 isoform X2 [Mya arenaria]|nr:uncharacterized protein LOC128226795 isoform X2 [Mya arenaria]